MTNDEKAAAIRITQELIASHQPVEKKAAEILFSLVCCMDSIRAITYSAGIGFDLDWSEFKNSREFIRSKEFVNWRKSVARKRAKKVVAPAPTSTPKEAA